MTDLTAEPVAGANAAAQVLSRLEEAAWVLAGFEHLVGSGALSTDGLTLETSSDEAAARMLAAVGLVLGDAHLEMASGLAELLSDGSLDTRRQAMISTLRQVATATGILDAQGPAGWGAHDDATLLAQGRSSALGGQMLATYAIPSLEGLSERFAAGGDFLDVGVGVAQLAAAFCEAMPSAQVVGIDVLPRALDLARETIAARGLAERLDVRLCAVQELTDEARFDLAWMPAPFLPEAVFAEGLGRVRDALRPGAWLIVGAGRFDGDALAVAVTRWKTLRSGGTPLDPDRARAALDGAGFVQITELPTPPGTPALYAGRVRSEVVPPQSPASIA
jgi:SAM-dependent methyltransferase